MTVDVLAMGIISRERVLADRKGNNRVVGDINLRGGKK